MTRLPIAIPIVLFACCVLAFATRAPAAEMIRLHLASGRTLTGEVSPRTSVERLWLVHRGGNAQIARPIAWHLIVAADFRQQPLTGSDLQNALLDLIVIGAAAVPQRDAHSQDDPPTIEELPAPREAPLEIVEISAPKYSLAPASVRFDAHIANWDADVEADGIVVQVVPVDAHGHGIPVRGSLEVELFGVRHIAFQDAPQKRGRSYERLARWTQLLAPHYFHSDGAWFKLPFQAAQPEFDSRIGFAGMVHVKLVVPGAGVYEDSLDGIRLRPFAPLRDSLERDTGRRFFSTETTGHGKRNW